MKFLLTVSAQVIIQFLYGSCSRRRREQKEKVTEKESRTGGDESVDEEDEEFELIPEETLQEMPSKSRARGSQEDPKEEKSEDEGQTIFVTRYGEVYHLHEDCDKTKGYAKYKRSPCEACQELRRME